MSICRTIWSKAAVHDVKGREEGGQRGDRSFEKGWMVLSSFIIPILSSSFPSVCYWYDGERSSITPTNKSLLKKKPKEGSIPFPLQASD